MSAREGQQMGNSNSAAAFSELNESGQVDSRRHAVWEALEKFAPCTGSELYDRMLKRGSFVGQSVMHSNVRARLEELERMGLTKRLPDIYRCTYTGKRASLWVRTDRHWNARLPLAKKVTKTELLAAANARIAELEAQLAKGHQV